MNTTMYLGSMDHSPSEQLGAPQSWHTTVLVLSEGGEHFKLAADIARRIGCKDGTLKRWSGRRDNKYKRNFEQTFYERMCAYPVHIRAISAQGRTITASFDHMVSELGLSGSVHQYTRNGKRRLEFGPFVWLSIDDVVEGRLKQRYTPTTFDLSERQGIPLIFIAHFLFRKHQEVLALVQDDRPKLEWIDWQIMPNKFPGDIDGPMANLFHAMMSGTTHASLVMGNIRVMMFCDSRADHGSILSDNLAGLLAQKLISNEIDLQSPQTYGHGASFFWDVWN